jgi:hypothetical protein
VSANSLRPPCSAEGSIRSGFDSGVTSSGISAFFPEHPSGLHPDPGGVPYWQFPPPPPSAQLLSCALHHFATTLPSHPRLALHPVLAPYPYVRASLHGPWFWVERARAGGGEARARARQRERVLLGTFHSEILQVSDQVFLLKKVSMNGTFQNQCLLVLMKLRAALPRRCKWKQPPASAALQGRAVAGTYSCSHLQRRGSAARNYDSSYNYHSSYYYYLLPCPLPRALKDSVFTEEGHY